MRILLILVIILGGICVDSITKYYFDHLAWQKYCYVGSPYIVEDTTHQYVGACSTDMRTGLDFYSSIRTDIYTPVLSDWFGFQLSYNRGIAFSLPIHGIGLQIGTIVVIVFLLLYYIQHEWKKRITLIDIGFACIMAGALSHAYERIVIGHVIDFISVKYFAILNFADILISIGAALLVLGYFIYENQRN